MNNLINNNFKRKAAVYMSVLSLSFFASCNGDDDAPSVMVEQGEVIEIPETYTFTRDGESSVSFSGQTSRLRMVNEIGAAFKVTTTTLAEFTEMFSDGTGFEEAALNESGKNVNKKVGEAAADQAAVQATIKSYFENQVSEVFPEWEEDAEEGVAGVTSDGRYVNAKGLEYNQAFYKGLIGALVADQALNDYLAAVSDDDNETIEEGDNHTEMEHHFDEAYGYVYGNIEDDSLMYKYIGRVDGDSDFGGIAEDIENAFIAGRTAIVNKDYDERDAQIAIIRENISKVIAVRAVYYLQGGKGNIGKPESFHDLSEGYGFVYSLQFTHDPKTGKPYFTTTEVEDFITDLEKEDGFWDVTTTTLDDISDDISKAFGFTTEQAAN